MSVRQPWANQLTNVGLRQAGPEDRIRVSHFLAAMDHAGLYRRHFSHGEAPNLALLRRLDEVDQKDCGIVLAVTPDEEVIAHGEYVGVTGDAEFALMVLPDHRVQGIGRRLLTMLIAIATTAGNREMRGVIQASNTPALQLCLRNGFCVIASDDPTTVSVARSLQSAHTANPVWPLETVERAKLHTDRHAKPLPSIKRPSGDCSHREGCRY